jgi:hypothetical protein
MAVGLPAVGSLAYNGYPFDGATRLEINSEFQYDDAQRTVVCVATTLTVYAVIADNNDTDDQLEDIRARLSKAGGPLVFRNKGFGDDLMVNAGGEGTKDIRWGPHPKILSWKPIGSSRACEIVWECTTYLPPLCSANGWARSSGVMAFNYAADFSHTPKGFTTRTITGYLEIAQTRSGRNVPDCADLYRNLIKPPLPADFQRSQDYKVSANKSRLDFTITDRQIESANPWPEGVVAIRGNHRANWMRRGSMQLRNTISMDIELAANINRTSALKIFLDTAFKRINKLRDRDVGVLIDSFDVDEQLFGYGNSFSISYRILKKSLRDIFEVGMWEPIDTDWQKWKASMDNVFSQRGLANLVLRPGNDAIIDLCGGSAIPWNDQSPRPVTIGPNVDGQYQNKLPRPQGSWLEYKQELVPIREQPLSRQAYMQEPPNIQESTNQNQFTLNFHPPSGASDTLQSGGNPRYSVVLQGGARRVGYPIPKPAILSIGGQRVKESAAVFREWNEGDHFGVPVFGAVWQITYMLANSPGQVTVPRNLAD